MSVMLTVKETCEYLRIGRATLSRYMRRGLPHFKGQGRTGAVRIDRKKLDEWIAKRTKAR